VVLGSAAAGTAGAELVPRLLAHPGDSGGPGHGQVEPTGRP
jgi:hypothetical protein